MRVEDGYPTVATASEAELRVKGSRFLARVLPVARREEGARALTALRREHRDATHVCSAQRFGPPEEPFQHYDDDGEPSGTAGRPILAAIAGSGRYDLLVAVVRYYGGVKLGTGGLARAYGDAAKLALQEAAPATVWRHLTFLARCRYDDVGAVEAVLARSGGALVDVDRRFDDSPTLEITARRSRARAIADEIVEATAGRAAIDGWSDADG